MKMKRQNILTVISVLLTLSTLLLWGIVLMAIGEGGPGLPIVVVAGVILGVLGLVAAAGVSVVKRWGIGLAVVVSAFATFYAVGGAVVSDPSLEKDLCVVLAVLYVLVIVLVALPSARHSAVTRPTFTGGEAN